MEFIRVCLDMCGCFGVDRHGFGGGLALLWRSSVSVHIQIYFIFYIDADVVMEDKLKWRITGFYCHPKGGCVSLLGPCYVSFTMLGACHG